MQRIEEAYTNERLQNVFPQSLTAACVQACTGNNWGQRLPNFISKPNSFGTYSNDKEWVSDYMKQTFDGYKPKATENHIFTIEDNVIANDVCIGEPKPKAVALVGEDLKAKLDCLTACRISENTSFSP